MKIKIGLILGIMASLIFITAQAQDELDIHWVWGEVVTLDTQGKTLLLKYLDYETDQEKEISIKTDEQTTYENIQSIDEIDPKDTLSIDYIISSEGENIAKNISVEKAESAGGMEEGQIQQWEQKTEGQEVSPTTEKGPETPEY